MNKKLYQSFHSTTSTQRKIIKKNNFTYWYLLQFISTYFKKKGSILDIGCGAGSISFYLAKQNHKILGIDISRSSIEVCQKSAQILGLNNAHFQQGVFPNISLHEKFDYIICSEVLEHIEDDIKGLQKIYSFLKPKGIAIFSVPSLNAPLFKIGYATDFDKRVGHLRRYTLENLKEKCISAKFQVLEVKKTEGIIRNFLFLNPYAGKLVRFIRYFLTPLVIIIDNFTIPLFGESQLFIIVKK